MVKESDELHADVSLTDHACDNNGLQPRREINVESNEDDLDS